MNHKTIIFLFLMIAITFSGCSRDTKPEETIKAETTAIEEATVAEAAPTETTTEITTEATAPIAQWELLKTMTVDDDANIVGFLNENFGIAAGYSGLSLYTHDGGVTWTEGKNSSWCRFGLDIYDENLIWTVGNSGQNRVSHDGGVNWEGVTDLPLKKQGMNNNVTLIDEQNIWITAKSNVAKSTDGGMTWTEVTVPVEDNIIIASDFSSMDAGYLLDNTGLLYKTEDGGNTWTSNQIDSITSTIIAFPYPSGAIEFIDESTGYLVYRGGGGEGFALLTTDGGSTWDTIELEVGTETIPYFSRDGKFLTIYDGNAEARLYQLRYNQ